MRATLEPAAIIAVSKVMVLLPSFVSTIRLLA